MALRTGLSALWKGHSASLLSVIGGAIAIVFRPLGFGEWRPVAASISGFTAKEAIIMRITMGVLAQCIGLPRIGCSCGSYPVMWFPSAVAAFSFLVFNLLDSPCLAAIATMAQQFSQEMVLVCHSLPRTSLTCRCPVCYQLGGLATGVVAFNVWTVIALICLAFMLFMLFRPDPYRAQKSYARSSVEAAS
ncbi:MAG: hypothetical protein ACLUCE_11020 [Streptococcus sp.]|uniref:hypothetical protein n=1 Tax=Streptococcus sp. TaxID=1306 RepID=UPI0039920BFA